MNDEGNGPQEPSPEELEAEVERLKAERQELEARVETLEAPKRHRVRRILTPILVILAVIVFTVSVPAVWGARTVLNTDRYVATVAPLADDPAVQQAIATRLTDEVFAALNVQEVISDTLAAIGERATLLAGPLTNALHGFVQEQVLKVVQSDAFETFWVEANRFVHTQVLAILRGESDTVSVAEGKVLLNLVPLVNLALASIENVSSDLVGRDVTLPTFEPGEVPSSEIAKLEQALGIDLPDNYGQIPVYDSQDLEALAEDALYGQAAVDPAADPHPGAGRRGLVGLDASAPNARPAHRGWGDRARRRSACRADRSRRAVRPGEHATAPRCARPRGHVDGQPVPNHRHPARHRPADPADRPDHGPVPVGRDRSGLVPRRCPGDLLGGRRSPRGGDRTGPVAPRPPRRPDAGRWGRGAAPAAPVRPLVVGAS